MSRHVLQGRTEEEVLWFRRRSFVNGAAAWVALGGFGSAVAQQRSNVVELQGDVLVNGERLRPDQFIQSGDELHTGPGSHLVFVVGNASFQVRQNTRTVVERGASINTVSVLRLLTGAVVSVWGRGTSRQILMPTLTAGIRGTGVYTEVFEQRDNASYFCNCYGLVELATANDRRISRAAYHQAFMSEPSPTGRVLVRADAINHTDEELEFLARLVGQRTSWQITGRRVKSEGY